MIKTKKRLSVNTSTEPLKPRLQRSRLRFPRARRLVTMAALVLTITLLGLAGPADHNPGGIPTAQAQTQKPYDKELMRLAEILGAVHYLRELCGSEDGQLWRDQMNELITAEGSSALRRARLTRRFNQGYRSYSRTYNVCTSSARTAIERFISEGVELSEGVLKRIP
ncbi:MAG: TIGR02301 family protein [Pseudomonadota bacterium]